MKSTSIFYFKNSSIFLLFLLFPKAALAHVKWFARDIDCGMSPQSLLSLFSSYSFLTQAALYFFFMLLVAQVDFYVGKSKMATHRWALAVDDRFRPHAAAFIRLALSLFFIVAVFYNGSTPVYLTPELKAHSTWVPYLQVGIAAALLLRRTTWIGAIGIAALYAAAIANYGWFHLLDYPIFLGVAVFVTIDSIWGERKIACALAILRLATGITLMWAGGEKWLYPWWSYPILNNQLKDILFGLDYNAFMYLAGFVEFGAAYALVFGRRTAQVAAAVLLVPFIAAIPVFGPVDAIGHSPIIAVLIILIVTKNHLPQEFLGADRWDGTINYAFKSLEAVFFTIGCYWLLHSLAYPQTNREGLDQTVIALVMMLPTASKIVSAVMFRLSDFRNFTQNFPQRAD